MGKSFKAHSETDWITQTEDFPGIEKINAGSLQRIADAAEAMAKNHLRLQSDLEYYQRRCKSLESEVQRIKFSRAGYMAALTKLKRRQNVHNS